MSLSLDLENRIDALLHDLGRHSHYARAQKIRDLVEYAVRGKEYDPHSPRKPTKYSST